MGRSKAECNRVCCRRVFRVHVSRALNLQSRPRRADRGPVPRETDLHRVCREHDAERLNYVVEATAARLKRAVRKDALTKFSAIHRESEQRAIRGMIIRS